MQKPLYICVLSLVFLSCGGSDGEDPIILPPDEVNKAPSVPELVFPTDDLLCINNTLDFRWNASNDENGDVVTYQVEISKDNQFSVIAHTMNGSPTTQTITLEKGIAYYWRVKATDSKEATSDYSSTFSFYTGGEGITNHLPFAPELIKPLLSAVASDGTIILEWTGSDTDGDPLSYDVYLNTNNPPTTLVSENQESTTFNSDIISATNYYWKIVAKDNKGGKTIGQVWNFSTN